MREFYIYLDDVRHPEDQTWWICRDTKQVFEILGVLDYNRCIVHLSLDHDLGEEQPTGYDLLNWIERKIAVDGWQPRLTFRIHSANPIGRDNMQRAIDSINRMLNQ